MAIELPTFFIDRDLGRKAFPEGLRAAGMSVVTCAEYYGVEECGLVHDEIWMVEAAGNGWPAFCCDAKHRKRRRPAERAALLESGLREFILNGNVSAQENVIRAGVDQDRSRHEIRGQKPGPRRTRYVAQAAGSRAGCRAPARRCGR